MTKTTINSLTKLKHSGEKITSLTAYDSTFSLLASSKGIDIILVGDSLGMVCQGEQSTIPVTLDDMCYHTRNVSKNLNNSMLMADLPFASYATKDQAMDSATKLMQQGAEIIKIEGDTWLIPTVIHLRNQGIPVCVHMGLTPQSINIFGGYKVQGRELERAEMMMRAAIELEKAGASMLLLECVPASLAREITLAIEVPVIGIGAGPDTDGQILVIYDMLGLTSGHKYRFVKNFMEEENNIQDAISAYIISVKNASFPAQEHCF